MIKVAKSVISLIFFLFFISCQRHPYEFDFSRNWTWEELESERPDSRALADLKKLVSLPDARLLLRQLSQLPNLNELKGLTDYASREIDFYRGTGLEATRGLPNTNFSKNMDGIIQAAKWLAEHRQLERPGGPKGVMTPLFSGGEFPSWKKKDLDPNIRIQFDFSGAEKVLELFQKQKPTDPDIQAIVNLPIYQAMIMHRAHLGMAFSDSTLFIELQGAAGHEPLNQVYKWINGNSYFDYGAVDMYRDDYLRVLTQMKKNQKTMENVITLRLADYLPKEIIFSGQLNILFGAGADGWASNNGFGVDLEYFKDDYDKLIEMMIHETYHACQKQVLSTGETLRREEESKWFDILYTCLNEGTASYISPPRKEENSEEFEIAGKQLLEDAFKAYLHHNPKEIERIGMEGEMTAGPFYWFGARMAWVVDTQLGRKALTDALIYGPVDFFSKYIRACKKASKESVPKTFRLSKGLEKEIFKWDRKLNRPVMWQRFRENQKG